MTNPKKILSADGYWHTSGNQILDSSNQPVRISGVNWFGLETGSFAPHGLWSRNYRDVLNQVKQLGFNTIRLPYSNQALDSSSQPNGIDFSKNPDLQGLSTLEIMDKVISAAGELGIKIILDQHRPDGNAQSPLWYAPNLSESKWVSDWQMLTKRYQNNSTVVGVDLHNEPHDNACWGCGDSSRDWAMAAEKAGNAILAINPNLLIVVEGVQADSNQWYWWGGNLMGVKSRPLNLNVSNRVVYSPHDYPQSVNSQPWFSDGQYPNNLPALWDNQWGYIHKSGLAPVVIGEFGTKLETESDRQWLATLSQYLKQNNISWIFWSLNPNSGDTGGILNDDWQTVNQSKMDFLRTIQGSISSSPVTSTPISTPAPVENTPPTVSPAPSSTANSSSAYTASYQIKDQWDSGFVADIVVTNHSASPVNGWSVSWNFQTGQQVQEIWGGVMAGGPSGQIKVTSSTWNHTIPAFGSVSFGFKGGFSGANPIPALNGQSASSSIPVVTPGPTPSPGPNPTSAPSQTAVVTGSQGVEIWWPTQNTPVSGTQPIKSVLAGANLNEYSMNWQVDGGQLNPMNNSDADGPHKEALIDVSGWNWRGVGPYQIDVIAKKADGTEIGRKSVLITVNR